MSERAGRGFDQEKFTRMLSRVSERLNGTLVMQMCFIADRLGLFNDLTILARPAKQCSVRSP